MSNAFQVRAVADIDQRTDARRHALSRVLVSVCVGLVLLCGAGPVMARDAGPRAGFESTTEFLLGAGDVVSVFVWKRAELSVDVPVRPDGFVSIPLAGEIRAGGHTVAELETRIIEGLKRQIRDPQITVSLKRLKSYTIYVLGEVKQAGVFDVDGAVSIVQALAMAGGLTPFADKNRIILLRRNGGTEQRYVFDYERFLKGDGEGANVMLRPGDTLVVP